MLLPYSSYDVIFEELRNKKIYFHCDLGWSGDTLIDESAKQLFRYYGMATCSIEECDFILETGGGNLGNNYIGQYEKRSLMFEAAKQLNKRMIILPKTFYGYQQEFPEVVYKVYARESITKSLIPQSILAPDLALAFNHFKSINQPIYDFGLFLRNDEERTARSRKNVGDPCNLAGNNFIQLFDLASDYATICTNRLHLAIVGLLLKRNVILLPNSYFKNYAMYITWLKKLGCQWEHDLTNCNRKPVQIAEYSQMSVDNDYTVWHYGLTEPRTMFGFMCFKPDGKIGLYRHPNETFWKQNSDGSLYLIRNDGVVTTHFPIDQREQDIWYGNHKDGYRNHYIRKSKIALTSEYF